MILKYYQLKVSGDKDRYLYILAPDQEKVRTFMWGYRRAHGSMYNGYHMMSLSDN